MTRGIINTAGIHDLALLVCSPSVRPAVRPSVSTLQVAVLIRLTSNFAHKVLSPQGRFEVFGFKFGWTVT